MTSLLDRWTSTGRSTGRFSWLIVVMSSFAAGSRAIEAERVVGGDQVDVGAPELAVRSGILHVPRELFADDAHDDRLVLRRKRFDALRPRRNRVEHQQDHFDDGDGDFEALRDLALRAGVARFRIRASPEPEQHEHEEQCPSRRTGSPSASGRGRSSRSISPACVDAATGSPSKFSIERSPPRARGARPRPAPSRSGGAVRAADQIDEERRERHRASAPTTPSMKMMPVLVAIAIGASLLPKQTGHASAARGAASMASTSAARRSVTAASSCAETQRRRTPSPRRSRATPIAVAAYATACSDAGTAARPTPRRTPPARPTSR